MGNDMRNVSVGSASHTILTNPRAIAIDQVRAGEAAKNQAVFGTFFVASKGKSLSSNTIATLACRIRWGRWACDFLGTTPPLPRRAHPAALISASFTFVSVRLLPPPCHPQIWARTLANGDVAVVAFNSLGGVPPPAPCAAWNVTVNGYYHSCGGVLGTFANLTLPEVRLPAPPCPGRA